MPHVTAKDGTRLYCEEVGTGTPIVFVHEYAGDWRTWEPQLRRFSRSHRCITFSARGYPPSDVPQDGKSYSQDIARGDVIAVRAPDGAELARGLANYSAVETRLIARKPSSQIAQVLGYANEAEMIHRDNLVLR